MKKIVLLFGLFILLFSCKKESNFQKPQEEKPDFIELPNHPNPGRFSQIQSGASVIFLDFDGQGVYGTQWNDANNPVIYAAPSIETAQQQINTLNFVKERYSTFNVTVTTDSTVYWAADQFHRIRCILTPTWQWYSQTGGVAFINSFTWGTNEVCWAFETTADPQIMAQRATHEVGHTLGLRHQCIWAADCSSITVPYNPGSGTGVTSWAPTMGVAYGKALWTFTVGHDSQTGGCTTLTDEYAVINNDLSNMPDLVYDDFTTDEFLNNGSAIKYMLESTSDVDMFLIPTGKWSCYITVTTYGTLDVAVDVYDINHVLKGTIDPGDRPDIPRTATGGVIAGYQPKFFKVRATTHNDNIQTGSQRGSYTIKAEY